MDFMKPSMGAEIDYGKAGDGGRETGVLASASMPGGGREEDKTHQVKDMG
jgi:hypothetical protein